MTAIFSVVWFHQTCAKILKRGNMRHISLTPDNKTEQSDVWIRFLCHHTQELRTCKNSPFFWLTLHILVSHWLLSESL